MPTHTDHAAPHHHDSIVTRAIPKVELHVHLEGTVTPDMARRKAQENGVALSADIFTPDGNAYQWRDFLDLVTRVYQAMARCLVTRQDFVDVTYDYLSRCAAEGVVYVEIIACPGQCDLVNMDYKDMIDGIAAGIDRAYTDHGIVARMNVTLERHESVAVADRMADRILSCPHPYIVGLDIAGGEREGDMAQFAPVFARIQAGFPRPLGIRMHAGEGAGPRNVWDAINLFGAVRIGHGVRSIEDSDLVTYLKDHKIALEVCPTSNILAGIYPDYEAHPLRKLYDSGVRVSLASDDPGLFGCTIGSEYQLAHTHFGFTPDELLDISRTAIADSFLDDDTKAALLKRLETQAA